MNNKRKWLRIAAYIALPVFGMVVGAGLTVGFMRASMARTFSLSTQDFAQRITGRIASRYDLGEEQRAAIHEIVTARTGNMVRLRDEIQPRIFNELQAFHSEVGAVLPDGERGHWERNFWRMLSLWPFPRPSLESSPE